MKEQTTREVPGEVRDLFDEYAACVACRDECIKSVFRARRAIFYAKRALSAQRDGWAKVFEIWPETKFGTWVYRGSSGLVEKEANKRTSKNGPNPTNPPA